MGKRKEKYELRERKACPVCKSTNLRVRSRDGGKENGKRYACAKRTCGHIFNQPVMVKRHKNAQYHDFRYTDEEIRAAAYMVRIAGLVETAKLVGRSEKALRARLERSGFNLRKLNLIQIEDRRVDGRGHVMWTDAELRALRLLFPRYSVPEIAQGLGRSKKSVESKAQKTGIAATQTKKQRWDFRELRYMMRLYRSQTVPEVAKKLDRSAPAVQHKIDRLKIRRGIKNGGEYKRFECECECETQNIHNGNLSEMQTAEEQTQKAGA